MSGLRLTAIAIAACGAACLPTGPAEYDGPQYATSPTVGYADAGSQLGVADAGTSPWDAAVTPTPTPTPSTTTTLLPSDAGSVVDAGASDAGGTTGGGGGTGLTSCHFQATTTKPAYTAGTSYRAYVLAIWVQNSSGALVRTLDYYAASKARYLQTYAKALAGGTVDTVSGASISNLTAMAQDATWDLKDRNGQRVPDGAYTIRVEATSGNGQGPVLDVPFTLGGATPVDTSVADSASVSAVHLTCN